MYKFCVQCDYSIVKIVCQYFCEKTQIFMPNLCINNRTIVAKGRSQGKSGINRRYKLYQEYLSHQDSVPVGDSFVPH